MNESSRAPVRSVNPAAPLDPRTRKIIDRARLLCMEAAKDNDPECAFEAGVELEALLDDDELTRVRLARMRTDACGNFDYDHAADEPRPVVPLREIMAARRVLDDAIDAGDDGAVAVARERIDALYSATWDAAFATLIQTGNAIIRPAPRAKDGGK